MKKINIDGVKHREVGEEVEEQSEDLAEIEVGLSSGDRFIFHAESAIEDGSFIKFFKESNDRLVAAFHVRDVVSIVVKDKSVVPELEPSGRPSLGDSASLADRITEIFDEVKELLIRKNADYGDSFSKQYAKRGIMSALIRIDDKISRLESLASGQDTLVEDESIEDTVADTIGYLTLLLIELRKQGDAE